MLVIIILLIFILTFACGGSGSTTSPKEDDPPIITDDYGNTFADAELIDIGEEVAGTIGTIADIDFFKVTIHNNKAYTIKATPVDIDYAELVIYDANQTEIARHDGGEGDFSEIIHLCELLPEEETIILYISVNSLGDNLIGEYDLIITENPEADFMSPKEFIGAPKIIRAIEESDFTYTLDANPLNMEGSYLWETEIVDAVPIDRIGTESTYYASLTNQIETEIEYEHNNNGDIATIFITGEADSFTLWQEFYDDDEGECITHSAIITNGNEIDEDTFETSSLVVALELNEEFCNGYSALPEWIKAEGEMARITDIGSGD
jgi:hypothetical protein